MPFEARMFQFLIGRLQTQQELAKKKRQTLFQFLIGRLQTRKYPANTKRTEKFQFLIGRLQTNKKLYDLQNSTQVSIPHR